MEALSESNTISNSSGTFHERHICFRLPSKVNSMGILKYFEENNPELDVFSYSMPNLLFQVSVIFFLTQGFHFVLKPIGLPAIISQILAGLIFNPAIITENVAAYLFTSNSIEIIGMVSTIGVQFFMFQSGVKMDLKMLKTVGGKVLFVGFLGVSIPLTLSLATSSIIDGGMANFGSNFFYTTIYSMTSFPAIEFLLNDLNLLNSELGRLSLSTALVGDLFSLVLIIISSLLRTALQNPSDTDDGLISITFFIVFVALMVRPALKFMVGKMRDGMLVKDVYVYVLIAVFLGSVFLAHFYDLFLFYGPFIIGLAVPTGPPLGSVVLKKFEIVSDIFLPLFVTTCAMRVNFGHTRWQMPKLAIIGTLIVVITFAKFLASFLSFSFSWKRPRNDAAAFALIMCAKGTVELALYSFYNDKEIVMDYAFAFMVCVVALFSIIIPVSVKSLYYPIKRFAQYQKRNLMDSDLNSELILVSCIHVPGDVTAVIKLLEASCSGDTPLEVNVLHLIKLVAQSTPLFISHRKERSILCDYSYSANVIRLFNEFEQNNQGVVSVNAITAVSPSSFMYDDICTVALDKLASLIILPFHIRWCYQDGSIESEDHVIRELNSQVLDRAPCTIGILVDRYNNPKRSLLREDSSSSVAAAAYHIAIIFLGGGDDREALIFAIRMAQDTRVKLSVIHLIAVNDENQHQLVNNEINERELQRDEMILRYVREQGYIKYRQEMVNDVTETTNVVRSVVIECDLMIVGRRNNMDSCPQTAGLEEWCEFPELGVLGDFILDKDTHERCSIFVVQQQR